MRLCGSMEEEWNYIGTVRIDGGRVGLNLCDAVVLFLLLRVL